MSPTVTAVRSPELNGSRNYSNSRGSTSRADSVTSDDSSSSIITSTTRSNSPIAPHSSRCSSPSADDRKPAGGARKVRRTRRESHEHHPEGLSKTATSSSRPHHSNTTTIDRFRDFGEIDLLNRSNTISKTLRKTTTLCGAEYVPACENDNLNDYLREGDFFEYNYEGEESPVRKGYSSIYSASSHGNDLDLFSDSSDSEYGDLTESNSLQELRHQNKANNSNVFDNSDENPAFDHRNHIRDTGTGFEKSNSPVPAHTATTTQSVKPRRQTTNSTRKQPTTSYVIAHREQTAPRNNDKTTPRTNRVNPETGNAEILQQAHHRVPNTDIAKSDKMTPTSGLPPTMDLNGTVSPADVSGSADELTEVEATLKLKRSPRRSRKTLDPNHVSHQFFHQEPCLYSHRMFQRAARIFAVLKHDDADTEEKKAVRRRNGECASPKEKIPDMDFIDSQEQIKTFELTFATLKFQRLFSHILDYNGFFYKHTELNDHYSLVYVMLHDLQTRRFQRRTPFPDEVLDPTCTDVEEAILLEKTKLQANIAKERIKNNAPSVDFLLPEHVRNKDETKSRTPVYMWVNQMKTTVDNVVANLKSEDFRLMDSATDMSEVTDNAFLIDPHCSDMLTFPPHLSMELKSSDMVKSGLLVQQDKSSCLAPQSVTHLVGNDNDVIHVNIGTAMTTCHIASLLRHKSPHSHIWAFGVEGPQKVSKVMKTLEFLEVKNIKLVHEDFLNIDPEESKYKGVRVILISANCSKSAITSPVQFIVSEGEDTQILGELSVGEADMTHVRDLMVDHERLLKHAMKFPKLQAVVYTTRSRFELENELVVTKVLEFVNANNNKRNTFKISPPVLPFSVEEINTGRGVDGRFLRFLPTDKANGCFVAIIAREPEESKEQKLSTDKKKSKVGKSKSAQSTSQGSGGGHKQRKSLKGTTSLPENVGNGIQEEDEDSPRTPKLKGGLSASSKKSVHKTPAGAGARLYQQGVMKKMEKARTPTARPEHLKVVRHPAPFREDETSPRRARSRTPRSHSGSRAGRGTTPNTHSDRDSVELQ